MDITRLVAEMLPAPDGESPMRHRTGIVVTVNADGTADLNLDGETVPDVAVLYGTLLATGDSVQVAAWAGDLLILGRVAESSAELVATEIVYDRAHPADSTISTTETAEATCTLAVPAAWNGYDLEAEASYRIAETGTLTAARLHVVRIRLTNTSGTEMGVSRSLIDLASPDNQLAAAVVGYLEGQTATGNVVVVLTAITPGDTGQTTIAEMYFKARAIRTS